MICSMILQAALLGQMDPQQMWQNEPEDQLNTQQ